MAKALLRTHFSSILPPERILDDALSLTAVATDASFYQIHPQIILDVLTTEEMLRVLEVCARQALPVTFRAAGTSLSGQSLGEGALVRISRGWRGIRILDEGMRIALEPGVIGAAANRALKTHQRKIGPDPATIQNCMIGGIAANNSSGMCCGTDHNTYRTMDSMKVIVAANLPVVLNTGDESSREQFRIQHGEMLDGLSELRREIFANSDLLELIRKKYKIKNTMGYALNSLVDYEDPIDILAHLMIGSEGTLGFISEITYRTIEDHAHRSCALLFFETVGDACRAATHFKTLPIIAAELMDRKSLAKVADKPGMPAVLNTLGPRVAALLIETRAPDAITLAKQVATIESALKVLKLVEGSEFSSDPKVFETWWNIRRGLFPSVGRGRTPGTAVIIEDVAFAIESLAPATEDLLQILQKNGYDDAILFGHVLDGNLHFAFAQNFNEQTEVDRYASLMKDLGDLVALKWKGSLKAEHGTGRNMAPFVELEWGKEAYSIMKRLKRAIDPMGMFNPGVMLNDSPSVHLEALKTVPIVDGLIDECIECGFCEVHCPSQNLTVTPRQRISAFRELARKTGPEKKAFEALMQYPVDTTCAADGMCAVACPVAIDTGVFIKKYRAQKRTVSWPVEILAKFFSTALKVVRMGLGAWSRVSKTMPMPVVLKSAQAIAFESPNKVVYLPSCISRTMGAAHQDVDARSLPDVMQSLFQKANLQVIIPDGLEGLCCGLPFESKGFPKQDIEKASEVEAALLKASENGKYPIISDTSPCSQHLKKKLHSGLKIMDSVEFMHELILKSSVRMQPSEKPIAIHVTCSSVQMGITQKFLDVAHACSSQVTVPNDIECCGFAGDKGFTHPELTRSALAPLKAQVKGSCDRGFSNSRTCEIGLSRESDLSYQSLAYLFDEVSSSRGEK